MAPLVAQMSSGWRTTTPDIGKGTFITPKCQCTAPALVFTPQASLEGRDRAQT